MTSNALSKKTFSTKAPAICKPPPWPPAVPPPPIVQAKFYVFASIWWRHWLFPTHYSAACFCTYDPVTAYWFGRSSTNPEHKRFSIKLYIEEENARWYGELSYSWPDSPGWGWNTDYGTLEGRPYIGGMVTEEVYIPVIRETTCVILEIPS